MFNVLLDGLPWEWNGYPVDMNFDTGIKVSQCLMDEELTPEERVKTALYLIFPEGAELDADSATEALRWYLNGWNHDNTKSGKKKDEAVVMDFDIDQWRIYAAFRAQYGINLNRASLHFWEYMGLLSNLTECAFTQVVSIRSKEITSKMSKEEKTAILKAKKIYAIKKNDDYIETEAERAETAAALEEFNRMRAR